MNANSGYWTSINLMNVGASSGTVTCTFTPYGAVLLPTLTKTLAPGEGISWLQAAVDEFGSTKYIGSATCSAPGTQIVAIVNELGASSTADQLLVYEGINMP
jgi:ABC-type sulfate transport system permease component